MLKEFIAHIQKTTQPFVQQVDGSTFVISGDGGVEEIHPAIYHPDTLPLHSLEALVKMVQTEAANMTKPLYITIPQPPDRPLLRPAGPQCPVLPAGLLRGQGHRCAGVPGRVPGV